MKKLIIFDVDGTLYDFNSLASTKFSLSPIYAQIKENAFKFLEKELLVDRNSAMEIYDQVLKEFNGEASIGFEKKYKIDRYKYFANTWNIEPKSFMKKKDLLPLFKYLNTKGLEIAFLTSAPKVWADRVLEYFNLKEYQNNLFSGEPDLRKPNPEAFNQICNSLNYNPLQSISVGDQLETDILPAKSLGMKTILIGMESTKSDFSINSLEELPEVLEKI